MFEIPRTVLTYGIFSLMRRIDSIVSTAHQYSSRRPSALAISSSWEPVPDVTGELESDNEEPYPTHAVAVAIEILSPSDPFTHVIRKCRHDAEWGVDDILVFDPIGCEAWYWDNAADDLARVNERYAFKSKPVELTLAEVFRRLDAKLKRGPQ